MFGLSAEPDISHFEITPDDRIERLCGSFSPQLHDTIITMTMSILTLPLFDTSGSWPCTYPQHTHSPTVYPFHQPLIP